MSNFNKLVDKLLTELANVAGGAGAVTGPVTSGNYGNQFPSQNDNAYAPGDARIPSILGARPSRKVKRKKKHKSRKVATKVPIQRRSVYLPGM